MRTRRSVRNQDRLYRLIGAELKQSAMKAAARELVVPVAKDALVELEQMHSKLHPECKDHGPETCPAWGAIHGLRGLCK